MKGLSRKKLRLIRDIISSEARNMAEQTINEYLLNYINQINPKVVAGYYPINSEVSVLPVFERLIGCKVCLPRIEDGNLVFRRWNVDDPLELNKYCYEPIISMPIEVPDLVIVPCLGYDMSGNRIGYGAGYYDRYLKNNTNAKKVLVAFSQQEVGRVEVDEWDVKVDVIINEVAIHLISK